MKPTIILMFLTKIFSSYISIPFTKQITDFNENYLFDNNILVQLYIGTPKINIKLNIDFYGRLTYIPDISLGGLYSNNSKSFKNISKEIFQYTYNSKTYYFFFAQDNFYIHDRLIENINFSYIYYSPNNGTLEHGLLGFQTPSFKDEQNIKYQLKNKGLINDYIYKIKFLNEKYGEIIVGTNTSEITNTEVITAIEISYENMFIKFKEIKYKNTTETNPRIGINYNLRGIFVTSSYFKLINETFFLPLINKNKCKIVSMNNSNNKFIYFVCDEDVDTKNFEEINIINFKQNITFKLTHNDLFKIYNNKKYCLVFHDLNEPAKWTLGQIFFEKYPMIINEESKSAIYYIKNNSSNYFIINIIIVFICLIIIIILSLIIVNLIKNKKRRIKVNELEDNYDYITFKN